MRILILGADGMIGHKIAHSLGDFELILASRKTISSKSGEFNSFNTRRLEKQELINLLASIGYK